MEEFNGNAFFKIITCVIVLFTTSVHKFDAIDLVHVQLMPFAIFNFNYFW